jgi:NAD(P)-dependent dehydrogenase (short-subunit alcohol dehydrogenase family)
MILQPGQVAVVTGGGSGIGLALAEAFAARGLLVVIGDLSGPAAMDAADRLRASGGEALGVEVDVRDAAAVDSLAQACIERFGRVDVVCNNAGVIGPEAPMWEQDLRVWQWMVDVVLLGVVHGIRAFVPLLVAQGSGHVLNTASAGGLSPLPGMAPYGVAKAGVVALTDTLRSEFRRYAPGVGATALCPGHVQTNLVENSLAAGPSGVVQSFGAGPVSDAAQTGRFASLTAAEVASAAIEGIERNRAHVITHPDAGPQIRRHVDRLLVDLPAVQSTP